MAGWRSITNGTGPARICRRTDLDPDRASSTAVTASAGERTAGAVSELRRWEVNACAAANCGVGSESLAQCATTGRKRCGWEGAASNTRTPARCSASGGSRRAPAVSRTSQACVAAREQKPYVPTSVASREQEPHVPAGCRESLAGAAPHGRGRERSDESAEATGRGDEGAAARGRGGPVTKARGRRAGTNARGRRRGDEGGGTTNARGRRRSDERAGTTNVRGRGAR